MNPPSTSSATSENVVAIHDLNNEQRLVVPIPSSVSQCSVRANTGMASDVAVSNVGPAIGDYIHLKCPTTDVHYGVPIVGYCEISTLHRVVYDSDEGYRWDDVNLNPGGLEWQFDVDPNVSGRCVFPTNPSALLGRILRISEKDGATASFARTAFVQQYCPAVTSARLRRRVHCCMNRFT